MDIISLIKQNPQIISLFKIQYPELQFEQLNDETVKDMIESMYGEPIENIVNFNKANLIQDDTNDDIIEYGFRIATSNIPEMMLPSNLILLNGSINNIPVKILFDTGADSNYIYKSKVIEAGLENIVDKNNKTKIWGINSKNEAFGRIWYAEIELQTFSPNKEESYATIGLNFIVCDDNTETSSNAPDIILGTSFMKSYKANIDFNTNIIILNNDIKIKF